MGFLDKIKQALQEDATQDSSYFRRNSGKQIPATIHKKTNKEMNIIKRIKNIWFLSGISKEDVQENPHSFMTKYVNSQDLQGRAYIVGLSDEEQSFAESINKNVDVKIQ